MRKLVLVLSVLLLSSAHVVAGHHGGSGCNDCGCQQNLRKVCRWVCEIKEVKDYEWKCECEDFCIPGPSSFCRKPDCDCDCDNDCCRDCQRHLRLCDKGVKEWGPPCGCCVRTKKKLIKVEVVKKVPVYKCVIETVCDNCGCDNGCNTGCNAGCATATDCGAPAGVPAPMPGDHSAPLPPAPTPAKEARQVPGLSAPMLSAFAPASR